MIVRLLYMFEITSVRFGMQLKVQWEQFEYVYVS